MSKTNLSSPYRIYLLSVWREGVEGGSRSPEVRFSLEDPRTGERQGFNSPQALVDFFEAGRDELDENAANHGERADNKHLEADKA